MTRRKMMMAGRTVHLMCVAFLIIGIQPAISLALLPFAGGHPMLWHALQCLFQALLLGGYVLGSLLPRGYAMGLQLLGALALALVASPLLALDGFSASVVGPLEAVGLVALTYGPAFLVLSTSSVLAMRRLEADGEDVKPLVLYAACNAGSLIGIALYTFVIQPFVDLQAQLAWWRLAGIVVMVLSAVLHHMAHDPAAVPVAPSPVPWRVAAQWWLGGAAPVALSLACTSQLTSEFGSHPIVWLGPFGAFLLTMTLAFSGVGGRVFRPVHGIAPALTLFLALFLSGLAGRLPPAGWYFLHLGTAATLMAGWHTWLYARRPADGAGSFVAWMAAGGLCGGIFAFVCLVLLNPASIGPLNGFTYRLVMDWVVPEYLFLIVFSAAVLGGSSGERWSTDLYRGLMRGGYLTAVVIVMAWLWPRFIPFGLIVFAAAGLAWLAGRRATGLAWATALVLVVVGKALANSTNTPPAVAHVRSMFGQLRVEDYGSIRQLRHGNAVHGQQPLACLNGTAPEACAVPGSYYAQTGPLGHLVAAARAWGEERLRIGVIGLGAGSIAAYCGRGDRIAFFEIDREVLTIAEAHFRFLSAARDRGGDVRVGTGDGRLLLRAEPDASLDLLVVDAFAANSIPSHLLTVDALAEYRRATHPGRGVIAFHTSGRYAALEPVIDANASRLGMHALRVVDEGDDVTGRMPGKWVFVADRDDWGSLQMRLAGAGVREIPWRQAAAWTDARQNMLAAFY